MAKETPTLIDACIRESFRGGEDVPAVLRPRLLGARKFMLDEAASGFLADLAHAAFMYNDERTFNAIESARRASRLPHSSTWVEYDSRADRRRTIEAWPSAHSIDGGPLCPPEEVPPRLGWLLEQHPQIETAFKCNLFVGTLDNRAFMSLFSWVWSTTDEAPPWTPLADGPELASIATGIIGYRSPCVSFVANEVTSRYKLKSVASLMLEHGAEMRRVLALLSCINDIPVGVNQVRSSRGYVARGSYRHFVDYSIISLNLPKGRSQRVVARYAVAMSRRRAHHVRGFWRIDWRNPPRPGCSHRWLSDDKHTLCEECGGMRTWVAEHDRGDASLGWVTHDYQIKHEEPPENNLIQPT